MRRRGAHVLDHARPRDRRGDDRALRLAERTQPTGPGHGVVGQQREERLLVRDLAAQGVGHAHLAAGDGVDQDAAVVGARDHVVDEHAAVHHVDAPAAGDQRGAVEAQIARVGDDRRNAARLEAILQDQELAPGRDLAEVRDQDGRRAGPAAPLGVAGEQRVEQVRRQADVRRLEALAEPRHEVEPVEDLAEVLGVGQAGRRLGVVFRERQRVGQQEGIEPRRRAGPPVAGIDARQARLGLGQPHALHQLGLRHRGGDDALADRGDRLGDGAHARLVGGVEEERPQERAQRPIAEREPRIAHPRGDVGPVAGRALDVWTHEPVPDLRRRRRRAARLPARLAAGSLIASPAATAAGRRTRTSCPSRASAPTAATDSSAGR